MRAVVDHHVDRPGVEAQQCVKLTGTNISIGLIQPVASQDVRATRFTRSDKLRALRQTSEGKRQKTEFRDQRVTSDFWILTSVF